MALGSAAEHGGYRPSRAPADQVYTTADGLAHNNVNRIVKDSRGFLWFCTAEGLSRFDGYAFANFGTDQGLPHAHVNDLLETRGGEYWVATNAGLVRFDPKGRPSPRDPEPDATTSGPMFAVVVPGSRTREPKRSPCCSRAATEPSGPARNNGLYRLEGAKGRRSLRRVEIGIPHQNAEQGFIQDLLEDARGSLWIAAPERLVSAVVRRQRGTVHQARWPAARMDAGLVRRSRRPLVGGNADERLLPLQR